MRARTKNAAAGFALWAAGLSLAWTAEGTFLYCVSIPPAMVGAFIVSYYCMKFLTDRIAPTPKERGE
jgi:hypothetical protein